MVVLLPIFSAMKSCRSLSIQTWAVLLAVCMQNSSAVVIHPGHFLFALQCLTVLLHLSQSEILFVHTQGSGSSTLGQGLG